MSALETKMKPSHTILTVDAVLLTLVQGELCVALFKRGAEPFAGAWALPGGYVREHEDQSAKEAAARVLESKAGVRGAYLEEFGTRSGPARDPRGWTLSVVYYALVPKADLPQAAQLFAVGAVPRLAFDHNEIVDSVVARVRSKSSYSSLPVFLCEEPFTVPELHAVYEAVLGEKLHKSGFRRKLDDLAMLEPVQGATRLMGRNRPAQLYRVAKPFRDALATRDRGL